MLEISVVVVDDDIQLLETSSKILAREIKKVNSFSVAYEALAYIDSNKPDIVITDIKMANINGLEFVRIIRDLYPELPVIVVSAFSDPEYISKAEDLKVDSYLTKPVDIDNLIDIIKSILA